MDAPFHRILVPTDFSADAEHALHAGSELSRIYGAPLTLIHVYDPTVPAVPDGYMMHLPARMPIIYEDLERRLAQAQESAREAGAISVKAQLLEGLTATEIVRFANDGEYDLIVMGTHGRKGVARVLLGSVAARVVQTAACAVLTVKRPDLPPEATVRAPATAGQAR
jgi:nucleotide-binding universal stress UspA family protein